MEFPVRSFFMFGREGGSGHRVIGSSGDRANKNTTLQSLLYAVPTISHPMTHRFTRFPITKSPNLPMTRSPDHPIPCTASYMATMFSGGTLARIL